MPIDSMAVTFERSTDNGLIRQILTEPRIGRQIFEDGMPASPPDLPIADPPRIAAIVARDRGEVCGLFLLLPVPGRLAAEVHFAILPHWWGRAEEIGIAFVEWVWQATGFELLIGPVPSFNRLALQLARRVGFREYGRMPGGTRHGKPFELIVLEIQKS